MVHSKQEPANRLEKYHRRFMIASSLMTYVGLFVRLALLSDSRSEATRILVQICRVTCFYVVVGFWIWNGRIFRQIVSEIREDGTIYNYAEQSLQCMYQGNRLCDNKSIRFKLVLFGFFTFVPLLMIAFGSTFVIFHPDPSYGRRHYFITISGWHSLKIDASQLFFYVIHIYQLVVILPTYFLIMANLAIGLYLWTVLKTELSTLLTVLSRMIDLSFDESLYLKPTKMLAEDQPVIYEKMYRRWLVVYDNMLHQKFCQVIQHHQRIIR